MRRAMRGPQCFACSHNELPACASLLVRRVRQRLRAALAIAASVSAGAYSRIGDAPMVVAPTRRQDRPILDFDQAEKAMSRVTLATTVCAALLITACERPGDPPAAGSGSASAGMTTAAPARVEPTPPMPPPAAPPAAPAETARDTPANRPADAMTRQEESSSMPKAGQVNNESSTALDKR